MLEGLRNFVEIPTGLFHEARILDRYYMESRYHNGFPEGSPQDFQVLRKLILEKSSGY
jgi:hypothetical protein